MEPHAAERRHLERQIAYARPIFMVLSLVDLLERPPADRGPHSVAFVTAYLAVSIVLASIQNLQWTGDLRLPLWLDLAALGNSARRRAAVRQHEPVECTKSDRRHPQRINRLHFDQRAADAGAEGFHL